MLVVTTDIHFLITILYLMFETLITLTSAMNHKPRATSKRIGSLSFK